MKKQDVIRPAKRLETRNRVIRSAMGRAGIRTQRDLAERMGLEEAVVSNRFTGRTKWDIDQLRDLDRAIHFQDEEMLKLIRG